MVVFRTPHSLALVGNTSKPKVVSSVDTYDEKAMPGQSRWDRRGTAGETRRLTALDAAINHGFRLVQTAGRHCKCATSHVVVEARRSRVPVCAIEISTVPRRAYRSKSIR